MFVIPRYSGLGIERKKSSFPQRSLRPVCLRLSELPYKSLGESHKNAEEVCLQQAKLSKLTGFRELVENIMKNFEVKGS